MASSDILPRCYFVGLGGKRKVGRIFRVAVCYYLFGGTGRVGVIFDASLLYCLGWAKRESEADIKKTQHVKEKADTYIYIYIYIYIRYIHSHINNIIFFQAIYMYIRYVSRIYVV